MNYSKAFDNQQCCVKSKICKVCTHTVLINYTLYTFCCALFLVSNYMYQYFAVFLNKHCGPICPIKTLRNGNLYIPMHKYVNLNAEIIMGML